MQKISGLVFWILLGLVVMAVPIACGSNNTNEPTDSAAADMTRT